MKSFKENIDIQIEVITDVIVKTDRDLLSDFPVEHYIAHFDAIRVPVRYGFVPEGAVFFCSSIEQRAGREILEQYHKLVLVFLMRNFPVRRKSRNINDDIQNLFADYFDQVLKGLERPKRNYYLHHNDAFAKDLAVCRMKLWPCGAELLDENSGFPRSTLLKGGAGQLLAGLRFLMFRMRGSKPFFETHFDPRFLREFDEGSYDRMYARIADMLVRNPHIKGVLSSSWWHDPVIEQISPKLWFLTRVPTDAGAISFCVGSNEVAIADATQYSHDRKELYEQGKYRPKVYMLVWTRDDLIKWAGQYRSRSS